MCQSSTLDPILYEGDDFGRGETEKSSHQLTSGMSLAEGVELSILPNSHNRRLRYLVLSGEVEREFFRVLAIGGIEYVDDRQIERMPRESLSNRIEQAHVITGPSSDAHQDTLALRGYRLAGPPQTKRTGRDQLWKSTIRPGRVAPNLWIGGMSDEQIEESCHGLMNRMMPL